MATRLPERIAGIVAIIFVAGAACAVGAWLLTPAGITADNAVLLVALAVAVLVTEAFPIVVVRDGDIQETTTSTTFSVALLVAASAPVALTVQIAASTIADLRARKAPWRIAFNAGQLSLSYIAAGACFALLRSSAGPGASIEPEDLPAFVVAALVFYLTNSLLVGATAAHQAGRPPFKGIASTVLSELPITLTMLGTASVVVVVGQFTPILLTLLLLPMVALHLAGRATLRERHRSEHDPITELANRSALVRQLGERLAEREEEEHLAVLFMDLDRFKEINDTLGHRYGDELLMLVAARLRGTLLPGETLARLGGDEFGLIIPDLRDSDSAQAAATRALGAFHEPIEIQGIRLEVDASVGIAVAPEHGVDVDTLMQRADIAMYQAKEADRRSSTYSHEDDQHSFDRLALLGELRRAIDEDQLRLVWMPIRSLRDRTVESIEALVRWEHPTRGTIPPGMFVPYAERTGLVRPMLLEVVEQALRQGAAWRSAGKPVRVAVNVSTRNLLDLGLPEDIRHLLERHGMPADLLELEITESTFMADPERARMVCEELDAMGVRLSIDDFGTGYSSMAYLKDLPVSALKLDRSFVTQMLQGDASASIVNSTIALATNLGIDVVAEGIEDERTEAALLEMGAGFGQGFVYGIPCPAGQVDFTEEGSWRL